MFRPGVEPGPRGWESSTLSTRPLPMQDKSLSPHSFLSIYYQWSLANLPTSHWHTPQILCHQNPFRTPPHGIRGEAKMGGFTVQILLGSPSPPEDGMVRITQLTQVKKKRETFCPGMEPGPRDWYSKYPMSTLRARMWLCQTNRSAR